MSRQYRKGHRRGQESAVESRNLRTGKRIHVESMGNIQKRRGKDYE